MSRANIITTSAGVQIGGHYIRPPARMSADEEALQRALIVKRRNRTADIITTATCVVALVALIVILA